VASKSYARLAPWKSGKGRKYDSSNYECTGISPIRVIQTGIDFTFSLLFKWTDVTDATDINPVQAKETEKRETEHIETVQGKRMSKETERREIKPIVRLQEESTLEPQKRKKPRKTERAHVHVRRGEKVKENKKESKRNRKEATHERAGKSG